MSISPYVALNRAKYEIWKRKNSTPLIMDLTGLYEGKMSRPFTLRVGGIVQDGVQFVVGTDFFKSNRQGQILYLFAHQCDWQAWISANPPKPLAHDPTRVWSTIYADRFEHRDDREATFMYNGLIQSRNDRNLFVHHGLRWSEYTQAAALRHFRNYERGIVRAPAYLNQDRKFVKYDDDMPRTVCDFALDVLSKIAANCRAKKPPMSAKTELGLAEIVNS